MAYRLGEWGVDFLMCHEVGRGGSGELESELEKVARSRKSGVDLGK